MTTQRSKPILRAVLGIGAALSLAGAVVFAQPLQLKAAGGVSCAGVTLPEKHKAFGVDLVLNGMGVRTVSVFNIQAWVGGLYVEKRTKNPDEVLSPERTKMVVMTFLTDTTRERMIESIRNATDTLPANMKKIVHKHLPDMERRLPEPKKGVRLEYAYGQGRLEMRHLGKVVGSWSDPEFATAMFGAWLGAKPVDSGLKQGLLGGGCK